MRALYFTLFIVAVSALPPRQYKKVTERKLELTTEAKIEPKEQPLEETKDPADKKETPEKEVPRAYYENQSVNVVSTTSTTITDQDKIIPQVSYAPQVNIGRPQVNLNPAQNVKPYTPVGFQNKQQTSHKKEMMEMEEMGEKKKNVYTVNVYVNFPNDQEYEYEDEECYKGKCWGKAKCKEGQVSVKGVCADRA